MAKFVCPVCQGSFPKEVWHCPECDSHNLIETTECEKCFTQKTLSQHSIVKVEVELAPPPIISEAVGQLPLSPPLIPKDWDYVKSLSFVKPLIYQWKNITTKIASELWIARGKLSPPPSETGAYGASKRWGGAIVPPHTWAEYCESIGLEKRTANRWLAAIFGNVQLPSPPLPKLESQVLYADPPWSYNNEGFEESAVNQYPTLTTP